jgi:crossover junction endodeoxyribonuclease RuvC
VTLPPIRLLGLDPGLRFTGWGVIEVDGNRLRHLADGVIATDSSEPVPERLRVSIGRWRLRSKRRM